MACLGLSWHSGESDVQSDRGANSKSYPISNEFTDAQSYRVANSKPYSISNELTDDTCQFAMRGELILERREWAMCSNNSVWRRGVRVASTDDSQ